MDEYILKQAVLDALQAEGITRNMRVYKMLQALKVSDVAPVRHGRWEIYLGGKYLMCSACKASFWDDNGDGGSNFCPNCGAKMDGGLRNE